MSHESQLTFYNLIKISVNNNSVTKMKVFPQIPGLFQRHIIMQKCLNWFDWNYFNFKRNLISGHRNISGIDLKIQIRSGHTKFQPDLMCRKL